MPFLLPHPLMYWAVEMVAWKLCNPLCPLFFSVALSEVSGHPHRPLVPWSLALKLKSGISYPGPSSNERESAVLCFNPGSQDVMSPITRHWELLCLGFCCQEPVMDGTERTGQKQSALPCNSIHGSKAAVAAATYWLAPLREAWGDQIAESLYACREGCD